MAYSLMCMAAGGFDRQPEFADLPQSEFEKIPVALKGAKPAGAYPACAGKLRLLIRVRFTFICRLLRLAHPLALTAPAERDTIVLV